MKSVLFILFFPLIVFGQLEVKKEFCDNGKLKLEMNYKDGKLEGLSKDYYENGQLRSFRNLKDGKPDGLWENYYEDGQLKEIGEYELARSFVGLSKIYYKNGQVLKDGSYKNEKFNGLFNGYYENGNLIQQVIYMDGNIISTKCWDEEVNEIECIEVESQREKLISK